MTELASHVWGRIRHRLDALVVLDTIDSTHGLALRLVDQLEAEGLAIHSALLVARAQRSGRGRGTNRWVSPPGGLYLSWIRSGLAGPEIALLPITAAAAAAEAVAGVGLEAVGIKWPNDLMVGATKLGGILSHARHGGSRWATVSLGVNLTCTPSSEELAGRTVTSIAEHLPQRPWEEWAAPVAGTFVNALEEGLARPATARDEYHRRLVHRPGDPITVRLSSREAVSGRFAGLTDEGHLRLEVGTGQRVISSGELVETTPALPSG